MSKERCHDIVRPLWIEIDLAALRRNLYRIRKHVGKGVRVVATIKQSAYGHGLLPVARELNKCGVDYFGVGSVEEAIELRRAGIKASILVLTAVLDKFCHYFIDYDIIPTVVDLRFARRLSRIAKTKNRVVPIHVKIDTGMGRLGVYCQEAYEFVSALKRLPNIRLEGIYTHFSVADTNKKFTHRQISVFNQFTSRLRRDNICFDYYHCANSIGVANYRRARFNMVRPGLILYGVSSAPGLKLKVEPVLTLKSRVIFKKRIERGRGVSYGRVFIAKRSTNIATVAVGYADGYPWGISRAFARKNCPRVIINGSYFKLAGRVCMDHIMVNLKNSDVRLGQEVVLIGREKKAFLTAQDVASWAGTIPYEIISGLAARLPRIYKNATA